MKYTIEETKQITIDIYSNNIIDNIDNNIKNYYITEPAK